MGNSLIKYNILNKNKKVGKCFFCRDKVLKNEGLNIEAKIFTTFANPNKEHILIIHSICDERRKYLLNKGWYDYYGVDFLMHKKLENEVEGKGDTSYFTLDNKSAYKKQKQWEEQQNQQGGENVWGKL